MFARNICASARVRSCMLRVPCDHISSAHGATNTRGARARAAVARYLPGAPCRYRTHASGPAETGDTGASSGGGGPVSGDDRGGSAVALVVSGGRLWRLGIARSERWRGFGAGGSACEVYTCGGGGCRYGSGNTW